MGSLATSSVGGCLCREGMRRRGGGSWFGGLSVSGCVTFNLVVVLFIFVCVVSSLSSLVAILM